MRFGHNGIIKLDLLWKTGIDIWFSSYELSIIVNKASLANSILGISLYLSNEHDIKPDISNVTA